MQKRKLLLINTTSIHDKITKNKIIINYVEEYAQEKQLKQSVVQNINLVWLYKKLYLPIELVGIRGDKQTEAFNNIHAPSSIE